MKKKVLLKDEKRSQQYWRCQIVESAIKLRYAKIEKREE